MLSEKQRASFCAIEKSLVLDQAFHAGAGLICHMSQESTLISLFKSNCVSCAVFAIHKLSCLFACARLTVTWCVCVRSEALLFPAV